MKNEMLEVAPLIGPIVGYAAGQALETVAQHNITRNREEAALLTTYEGVDVPRNSRSRVVRRAFASMAVVGAISGFAAGEAAHPNEHQKAGHPVLGELIDHEYHVSEAGTLQAINAVAGGVLEADGINVQATVAHNGDSDPVESPKQIKNDAPFGPSSMVHSLPNVMNSAFNSATPDRSGRIGTAKRRNVGVLAITNGNPIGNVETVVKQSQAEGDMPIFIANAGKDSDATAHDLKLIAQRTGGKYWHISKESDNLAAKIRREITPSELPDQPDPTKAPLTIIAVAAAAQMLNAYRKRRNETLDLQTEE